jgi:S-disulfanyl-L-cysteine oxidoreductase SoxD
MSITIERVLGLIAAGLLCANALGADRQKPVYGFGSSPSPGELERFFAPLPDGRGLPAGSGSVEQGKSVYQTQCLACHGQNLEGGLADRLVGGRGTLVNDNPTKAPVKTVESYWPYATTLFDYVKRAMPLTAPDSLSNDQVYAVTAYILSEAKVIAQDAVMDAKALAAVKMPNRDGFIPDRRPEKFPAVAASPHQIMTIK